MNFFIDENDLISPPLMRLQRQHGGTRGVQWDQPVPLSFNLSSTNAILNELEQRHWLDSHSEQLELCVYALPRPPWPSPHRPA